jgi:hypothetical protein
MPNLLLEKIDYKVTETKRGTWRRYMHPNGALYAEYVSRETMFGLPLLHYTRGRSPETGAHTVARGFLAVGRSAIGVIAIGRFAAGLLALGQLSAGIIGLGQLTGGLVAIGQFALGLALGLGQVATGFVCIAQIGIGIWVLAQAGIGEHLWTMRVRDPEAIELFRSILAKLR